MASSHTLDLDIAFDDTTLWPTPGCCYRPRWRSGWASSRPPDLGNGPGAHRPGRKLVTLIHSIIAGGDCIHDADLLRCGATSEVLGHRIMAPSTLGTFLRSSTFGHVRQLDQLTEQFFTCAWGGWSRPR